MVEQPTMNNKSSKPMLTAHQLVDKMRDEKGISFTYVTEEKAEFYLSDINNYLRTASYRKNFAKYTRGPNTGKYIKLDFAYLQELSTIDMHFRFLVSDMCLDIEHTLKVQLIRDVSKDVHEDAYEIVKRFLDSNSYILKQLEAMITSPFTGDLIQKYFDVQKVYNGKKNRYEHIIRSYDNCPIWVLCEVLTFGEFTRLYSFYYGDASPISPEVLRLVKSLRNGAAHNNCLLVSLAHGTSYPPRKIKEYVKQMASISTSQRQKKLSCRPLLEFVALLYTYEKVVTEKVKRHRTEELEWLFFRRMPEKSRYFKENDLIMSSYDFACKVIKESLSMKYLR